MAIQYQRQRSSFATMLIPGLWVMGIALCCAGCRHADLTGQWSGPLPIMRAEDCQIRLLRNGRFEFGCAGDSGPWGNGTWRRQDDLLWLEYAEFGSGGERLDKVPVPAKIEYAPQGNAMRVRWAGHTAQWVRILP